MLLFRSEEHSERWCEARGIAPGGTMTLATGWRLAHTWYHDKLEPGWRRRSAEEAEAVFAELGLTGEAWRLRPPPVQG
ncbi:MAG: hypothetical protein ACR2HN_02395 [Tepidiformaceae bacterium]